LVLNAPEALSEGGQGRGTAEGRWSFSAKSDEKEKSRWTLSEWMAQKDRNRMMDMWLVMHSPSPYEAFIQGTYHDYQLTIDTPSQQTRGQELSGALGFYALILGLEGFYENNWQEAFTDSGGLIGLRLFGIHVQNTHLILQYGVRNRINTLASVQQEFAGADLDLYVELHSGLHANYRYFIPTTNTYYGQVSGNRYEAAYFVEFGSLRLFGGWQAENFSVTTPQAQSQTRAGLWSGLRLYF